MSLITFIRDLQKIPEKIPAPGAILYNAIPAKLLREPEYKLAQVIVGKIKEGIIVDLGSGTGYISIEIAKSVPNVMMYGIDLSQKMVDISRRHAKGIENVRLCYLPPF
jgi:tRNA G46 methylase TrmB